MAGYEQAKELFAYPDASGKVDEIILRAFR